MNKLELLNWIVAKTREIKEYSKADPEAAHKIQDEVMMETLLFLSTIKAYYDLKDCREVALKALKANDIELRWKACS